MLYDELTRVRYDDRIAREILGRLTFLRRHVDHIHIWKRVEKVLTVGSASNRNRSAVHVHFSVADAVEPDPSERRLAIWETFGYFEGEVHGATIAIIRSRTTTLENLDDLEYGLSSRLFVQCDC